MFPVLIKLGVFKVYSYPLMIGLAWGIAYQFCLNKLLQKDISPRGFTALFIGIFITAWIGAKLLFLVVSASDNLVQYAQSSNFWLGGGFVFYGGFLFAFSFLFFYTVVLKKFPFKNCYLFLPGLALAHGIGRIGCFLAGCCFGAYSEHPWSVFLHGKERHPVQLYESIGLFILFYLLNYLIGKNIESKKIIFTYIGGYSLLRIFTEFFRGDRIRGLYFFGLSTSQMISMLLILMIITWMVFSNLRTKNDNYKH